MFTDEAQCNKCGERFASDKVLTVCSKCGGALLFRYDLSRVKEEISKDILAKRGDTFWKFIELLPISSKEHIVSLGEPYTPILTLQKNETSPKRVFLKDDGRLPTGTFKARGMAVAVSALGELGVRRIAVPSAGNAASALAAYGARSGIEVYAFMPRDVPEAILKECLYLGAKTYLVNGLINDAGEIVKRLESKQGWYSISTNKQPYRVEGYKVSACEIAEQFDWKPPDVIVFPTGGGEGVIGLWKGFKELVELDFIKKAPRLIMVQAAGCAPLVKSFRNHENEVKEPWPNAKTIAAGLKVPHPYASDLIFRALRETKGTATAVEDQEILSAMTALMKEGIYACPEAAATLAALDSLQDLGEFDQDESILLYLTGNALKYFDLLTVERNRLPALGRNANSLD